MNFNTGIVIRKTPYKDKSYILTLLTESGIVSGYYHENNGAIYKELFIKIDFIKNKTEVMPEGIKEIYLNITDNLKTIEVCLLICFIICKCEDLKIYAKNYYKFMDYLFYNINKNNCYNYLYLFLIKSLIIFGYSYKNFKNLKVLEYYKKDYKDKLEDVSSSDLLEIMIFYYDMGIINQKQLNNFKNKLEN